MVLDTIPKVFGITRTDEIINYKKYLPENNADFGRKIQLKSAIICVISGKQKLII